MMPTLLTGAAMTGDDGEAWRTMQRVCDQVMRAMDERILAGRSQLRSGSDDVGDIDDEPGTEKVLELSRG